MMLSFIASRSMLIIVTASLASGGYFYVQNLRHQLQLSVEIQKKLENVIAEKEIVMKQMLEDFEKIKKINNDLTISFLNSQKDFSELQKKFQDSQGRQRDFAKMATQNPKALQERINRGTQFALRCNEIVTGSPLKPEDDKNNICQELIKSKKVEKK